MTTKVRIDGFGCCECYNFRGVTVDGEFLNYCNAIRGIHLEESIGLIEFAHPIIRDFSKRLTEYPLDKEDKKS